MKTQKRIVVLKERWVFIGLWHDATDQEPAYLTEAACIRRWGTTAGLGQIALSGPTKETILDPCGIVVIEREALLFSIPCL